MHVRSFSQYTLEYPLAAGQISFRQDLLEDNSYLSIANVMSTIDITRAQNTLLAPLRTLHADQLHASALTIIRKPASEFHVYPDSTFVAACHGDVGVSGILWEAKP